MRSIACSLIKRDIKRNPPDLQHEVWRKLLQGKLYISPLEPAPGHRVLDIGTGTGTWAIEFAQANPSTQIIGVDLSNVQPKTPVPVNCQFQTANAEKDWNFPEPFDFIHSRLLALGMQDWSGYFRRCFDNLKPGGWIEAQDLHFPMVCDDGSAGPDSALIKWSHFVTEAVAKRGLDTALSDKLGQFLRIQGFVRVQEKIIKLPCSPWPEDEAARKLGRLQRQNFLMALDGVSMPLFTKELGWTKEKVDVFLREVCEELHDMGKHVYVRM